MASQRRLLLPRRISAERIVIERRKPGLPAGRIVVKLIQTSTGSLINVRGGVDPRGAVISAGVVGIAFLAAARLGIWAAVVTATVLTLLEALRWRQSIAGATADAAWLEEQLQRS
jgi:hypothetical protein